MVSFWRKLVVLALVAGLTGPKWLTPAPGSSSVLFFDGICNLCDGAVNFIADHDVSGKVQFGAIQKHRARLELAGAGKYAEGGSEALTTLVLVQESPGAPPLVSTKSTAAVKVLALLDAPWRFFAGPLAVVPRPVRDWAYELVAAHRYQLFGSTETCRAPTPRFEQRFLSEDDGGEGGGGGKPAWAAK